MSKKPWLTYGLGDGLDYKPTIYPQKPKKLSTAILCFLLFCAIGGHRLYFGDYKGALRWFVIVIGIQILAYQLESGNYWLGIIPPTISRAFIICLIISLIIREFILIRHRIEFANMNLHLKTI